MNKGIDLRLTIYNILYNIHKYNMKMDDPFLKDKKTTFNERDLAFINNVCLNSMRYKFHANKIIKKYAERKTKLRETILLHSAITQIVFLDFKDYAVIHSSVEVAKLLKMSHGFINACLRKISKNKKKLESTSINFFDLPLWFRKESENLNDFQKKDFLKNFFKEPSLHILFKEQKYLLNFKESITRTSKTSGFLNNRKKVEDISSYKKGHWWIQDYSSSFALNNIDESLINKSCLDMCAAPGGKSFQILSRGKKLVLNDNSIKRLEKLKENLRRLNLKAKILNQDFRNLKNDYKYDFIILDAPCSSVGTIRKNPEIFYKNKEPNFNNLLKIQKLMLQKAASILNNNGIILYMVCSFLKIETLDQIDFFLKQNKNFFLYNFNVDNKNIFTKNLINNNLMITVPTKIGEHGIDGYFSAYLKKN